ncbi:MAG: glycosyltransferase family 2 protein [Capnocytophaga sp.]|nr:glycosyltransferase family 2 protein [Capnocytophaga sp.]
MSLITASIVLYKTKVTDLKRVIYSFFNTKNIDLHLFLVDNSPTDELKNITENYINKPITYIFNNQNIGYGAGHNVAIRKAFELDSAYHIILNPDIYFEENTIEELTKYMENNTNVGNIMPKIVYPDGELQYLCKLLPTPTDLIFRRFLPFKKWKENRNKRYELHDSGYNKIMDIPNLSGCFMFLRTDALKNVGLFDENIFMYLEDIDLNRRIHQKYKTIFYPYVTVIHEHQKESYKNKKLLKAHIKSAIYYFNKYGWLFDKQRKEINKATLNSIM